MKSIKINMSTMVKTALVCCMVFLLNEKPVAQSCNQVEILYQQPDCYKPRDNGSIGPSQGKSCESAAACVRQNYTYSAGGGPWASYLWVISAGPATPPINPANNVANINITWPVIGTYILTLTVTDAGGNVFTRCIEVTVKDKPIANFTFAPNNACAGSTVNFYNTTVFAGTAFYSWNFGDPSSGVNNFSLLDSPTHVFNNPGSYTVTLIAYSSQLVQNSAGGPPTLVTCCADTIKKTVNVVVGNVKIECISTVCAGDTAKYTAVGCANPTWFPPAGGTILGPTNVNPVTVIWGNGNPQGQLSVQCGGGCRAYATVPIVPSNPVISGSVSPCNNSFSAYTLPYLPGTSYTWTLMDITTATNVTATMLSTYPDNNRAVINWSLGTPGDVYQLSIVLNNQHLCCTSSGSITITPKERFTVNGPSSICAGQTATFGTNPPGTFNWASNPTGGVVPPTSTGTATYSATFSTAGSFIITATNVSNAFCNNTASTTLSVVPVPTAGTIQGPLFGCVGSQYNYNMSTPAPAGYYYEWSVTSGTFQPTGFTTATGNSVTVQWASLSGTITVVLKQSTFPYCIIPAGSITVNAATVGSISGPVSVCVDGTVTYTLTGGNLPAGTTITWSISPASLGTITGGQGSNSITVLWHGQGGTGPWGPAFVNVSTGCGPATPWGPITIYPKFTFTISTTGLDVCQPTGMVLTATGAPLGTTFVWSPGGPGPFININTAGTYSVTGTNGGCSYTTQITIPYPFAIAPITCGVGFCNNGNITNEILGVQVLKPAAGTFTYQWFLGIYPGGISQGAPVTNNQLTNYFTAPGPGIYYVVVNYGICTLHFADTVKKVCCPDIRHPSISKTQITCNQWSFTGTATNTTGATITWNFGDGTTAPGGNNVPITHTYAHAGIYCVTFCVGPPSPNLTNCTGNCFATQVTVPIEAAFNYTMGCNGCLNVGNASTVIASAPAVVTYLWNFGDASTSTLQSPPQHCYALGGTYTVTLTVFYVNGAISCSSMATHTVVYTPLDISFNTPVCTGSPVFFSSVPSPFVTYAWNFGDGFTAYISPIIHIYNAPGIYTVTLNVTDALGNTCTKSKPDTVLPGISSCTILPAFICPGGAAILIGPAGPYTYAWQVESLPNVWVPAPGVNNTVNYTTTVPGFYHVIITNINGCPCTSNRVEVKTVPKPKASFSISPSKNICSPGGMVTLSAPMITGTTDSFYVNGNYASPVASGPVYMSFVGTTTTFNLIMTNEYGCKDTCTQTVTVNPLPLPPIITNTGLCAGVPITLAVTNYVNNITWNNGATTTSIIVYTAGTYIATYTNPVTGCSSSASVTINSRPSAGLFPHFCDSIPCNCTRPFVIYAPNPLVGIFASTYSIDWYNANTNVFLFNGNSYNNGGLGVQTGSYYIIIKDLTTTCMDTSNTYSVIVPKCDTCDCKGSHWGEITLVQALVQPPPPPLFLNCGGAYALECNKPYTINASFNCKDTSCKSKVTYSFQPPGGNAVTGTLPFTFTPTVPGVYTITLYGWCGNKICDSCVIHFDSNCHPDCCKGSYWQDGPWWINDLTGFKEKINCKSNKPFIIKGKDCNTSFTVTGTFICADSTCHAKVLYELHNANNGQLINAAQGMITIPAWLPNGSYIVNIYAYCGDQLCDSCSFRILKDCPEVPPENCCTYSIKANATKLTLSGSQNPNAIIATQQFNITGLSGVNLTEVRAEVLSYDLSSNYNNECLGCKTMPFTWSSIQRADNIGPVVPKITMYNSTVHPFNPSGAGLYHNPREVIWNNGGVFSIGAPFKISFWLPPAPVIECCEITAIICVKFTFRDDKCHECEIIVCFPIQIRPGDIKNAIAGVQK